MMCDLTEEIWRQILILLSGFRIHFVNSHIKCLGLYIRQTLSDFSMVKLVMQKRTHSRQISPGV